MVLTVALVADDAQPAEESEFNKNPLSLEQVLQLLRGDVSTFDILRESQLRGLSFAVDGAALAALEDADADEILLNRISAYSGLEQIIRWENSAKEALESGDLNQAVSIYTKLIEACPRYVQMLARRGNCHLELGDFQDAINDLTRVCEYSPRDYDARFSLAKALFRAGNANQAGFHLTSIIDELPAPSDNVYRSRASVYIRQGRYLEAAHDLRQAIKTTPQRPINIAELSQLLSHSPLDEQRDPQVAMELAMSAIEIVRTVEDLPPGDIETAYSAHGSAIAASGDLDAAVEMLETYAQQGDFPSLAEQIDSFKSGQFQLLPEVAPPVTPVEDALTMIYDGMVSINGGVLANPQGDQQLIEPFLMGTHEVTEWEWAMIMGEPPPTYPDVPKDFVNLPDALRFLRRLNSLLGSNVQLFRLPTEQEWEFAARAGQQSPWYFGDNLLELPEHAWFADNAEDRIHEVAQLEANPFGLYDVYGNVAEWCLPESPEPTEGVSTIDGSPSQSLNSSFAIHRGGSYANTADYVRSDVAVKASPRERLRGVGLRLAATPSPRADKLLARVRVQNEGLDRAIQELNASVRTAVNPSLKQLQYENLIALYYLRGVTNFEQGRFTAAISDFEEVLLPAVDQDGGLRALALTHLAWMHATCLEKDHQDGERALEEAERALALTQRLKWYAFSAAAAANASLGDFKQAENREEQALARAPDAYKDTCRTRMEQYKRQQLPDGSQLLFTFNAD